MLCSSVSRASTRRRCARQAAARVVAGQDATDLVERDLEPTQDADLPRVLDLTAAIASVAGCLVDLGRTEEADAVVVAQRLRRQPAQAGDAADRQELVR